MKKNNKIILTALLSLSMTSSFASCYEDYQQRRSLTNELIEKSHYKQVMIESGALSVSTNIVVLAALSATGGGGALPSTIGGVGMISAAMIASKYIDLRLDDSVKDAIEKKYILDASIGLLKEAYIGQGPHLAQALTVINQNISTSISLKDLADTIVTLDEKGLYCSDERIMSPAGIISLASQELRKQF